MRSIPAEFGPSSEFAATDEGFRRAMEADCRVMISRTMDWSWKATVDFAEWEGSRTLWWWGFGQLGCNVQREFHGAPMLQDLQRDWRLHFDGMNLLGNPSDDDAPLLDFAFLDRSSFQNGGAYAGALNLRLGHGGYVSQTKFIDFELHRARRQGAFLEHARKVVFFGSVERNGLDDPGKYAGIELVQDTDAELGNQFLDSHFEHDDPAHLGLWQRGGTGKIDVVRCSHTIAGLRIESADYSVERPRRINVTRWELPAPPSAPATPKKPWWQF